MKTEEEIRNYIEATRKRYSLGVDSTEMIKILEWILDDKSKEIKR